ncbi:MAG UNVERIFIED_CONTAM: hypothetical protein LVR29_11720 [Microcystis novacekii LVE1205-3]
MRSSFFDEIIENGFLRETRFLALYPLPRGTALGTTRNRPMFDTTF